MLKFSQEKLITFTNESFKKTFRHPDFATKGSPGLKKVILSKASDDLVRCICDISHKVLSGTAEISRPHKKRLAKHKNSLRKLVDRKLSLSRKKKIIQKGGFLGALLSAAIPAITGLLSNLGKG